MSHKQVLSGAACEELLLYSVPEFGQYSSSQIHISLRKCRFCMKDEYNPIT